MKTNYNVLNIEAVKGKYRFTDEESFPDIFGIPLFEISDALLEEIYYFRWSIYGKHITKTADGYVVTEFLPKVPWAGKHNTIPCPAHHHFYEGRWIHNREILSDYATFWFTPDATPRKYSFPAADSIYKTAQAWGDFSLPEALYEKLKENYEGWEKSNKTESGLFYQTDNRDGMELSISGNGIRPTINSYMYADALALFNIAKRCGRCDDAALFENKAKELRELINDTLWDSNAKFYKTLSECNDYKIADVRELIGYIPWCYGIADEEKAEAWKFLRDENHFDTPYGPTTAERCHPDFMKPHTHECWWNGPSWPFATSQTLGAMIEHIKSFDSPCID